MVQCLADLMATLKVSTLAEYLVVVKDIWMVAMLEAPTVDEMAY